VVSAYQTPCLQLIEVFLHYLNLVLCNLLCIKINLLKDMGVYSLACYS